MDNSDEETKEETKVKSSSRQISVNVTGARHELALLKTLIRENGWQVSTSNAQGSAYTRQEGRPIMDQSLNNERW